MDQPSSDCEIVAASLEDSSRFGELFERHYDVVARYVVRRLGPSAEDVAAEVFVRAFRLRDRFEPRHPTALPWLYGIASNVIADQQRSERRRLRALRRLASTATATHQDSDAGLLGLETDLAAGLARLPRDERDALLLMAWAELGYQEIADALGIPIGTVRSRIARARRQLVAELPRRSPAADGQPRKGEAHV